MPVEELSALALLEAAAVLLVEALVDQHIVCITGVCRMRMITLQKGKPLWRAPWSAPTRNAPGNESCDTYTQNT